MFICCPMAYTAPVDVTKMTISEIQEAIDDGFLTYEGLINIYLDRINEYDSKYNAIITINQNAISEAKKCDEEYKKNGRKSLLFGIPIIVKDNIDVYDMPTTAGSKTLKDNYPKSDAEVIKNLKNQGAIILAKANMSEFAFMASSSSSSYGTVKNAYNTKYSSYGSSGGSAVSVALSYAPLAIGTDTNASLRAPASANSVFGVRSTFGTLSTKGIIGYDITRDVVGPIARNVEDSIILYEGMTSDSDVTIDDIKDSDLKGIRIGVLDQFLYGDTSVAITKTDEKVVELTNKTLKKMEDAGATIVHIKSFYNSSYRSTGNKTLAGWTMCYSFNKYIKNTNSSIHDFKDLVADKGHIYSLWSYLGDCSRNISDINSFSNTKKKFNKDVNNLFNDKDLDVIVYPTNRNLMTTVQNPDIQSNSILISPILGLPAASAPMGYINDLPYGLEFMTLANQEDTLYKVLSAYEKINTVYKLPDIAPALYQVPESVEELKEIYKKSKGKVLINIFNRDLRKKYKEINTELEEFFTNYNNISDHDEKAKDLVSRYNVILEKVNNGNNFMTIVIIIIVLILMFYIRLRMIMKKENLRFKSIFRKRKKKVRKHY